MSQEGGAIPAAGQDVNGLCVRCSKVSQRAACRCCVGRVNVTARDGTD